MVMEKKEERKLDLFILLLMPLVSTILSLSFKTKFLVSTLLFFGLPAAYLSYKNKDSVKKSALFSLIFSLPLTLMIDYIGTDTKTWLINFSVFDYRLFGKIALEQFVWSFLSVYLVVIFYEYFFEKGKEKIIEKKMKYFVMGVSVVLLLFFIFLFTRPELLKLPYFYLIVGCVLTVIPGLTTFSFFPKLFSKFVKAGSYFFVLFLLEELVGIHLNHWSFPGNQFIGWVNLFGFQFPFEELFFFIILGAIGVLSYYEFFDDDRK